MEKHFDVADRRAAVDSKLTELTLYAKELCPGPVVESAPLQYEDDHVEIVPHASLSDAEVDRIELALTARAADIFAETGLHIVCAVLDPAVR